MNDLFGFEPDIRQTDARSAALVAFDFETTGLYPDSDRIVEFGAVKFVEGVETGWFEELVDPGMIIPAEASRISGITGEMVAGKPGVAAILPAFIGFLEGSVLLAHNLAFDRGFLQAELRRAGLKGVGNYAFDTCILARKVLPGMRSYALSSLADALGIVSGTSHRGLDDSRTCMRLFHACLDRMGGSPKVSDILKIASS